MGKKTKKNITINTVNPSGFVSECIKITDKCYMALENLFIDQGKYTISFYAYGDGTGSFYIKNNGKEYEIPYTGSWKAYEFTFDVLNPLYPILFYFPKGGVVFYHTKVESGEVATDWGLHEDDIGYQFKEITKEFQSKIDVNSSQINELVKMSYFENGVPLKDKVAQHEVKVDSITDSVSSIENSLDGVEKRVKSAEMKITDENINFTINNNKTKIYNVRYIRDYCYEWTGIKIIDEQGNDLALGRTPTSNKVLFNKEFITSGDVKDYKYAYVGNYDDSYVQIDLGEVHKDIDFIVVFHRFANGQTYKNTKTQISEDGIKWYTLAENEYEESETGKVVPINSKGYYSFKVTMDAINGLTLRRRGLRVLNDNEEEVFRFDENGNLEMLGVLTLKDKDTKNVTLQAKDNEIAFYDFDDAWLKVGHIGAVRKTLSSKADRGSLGIWSNEQTCLKLGYGLLNGLSIPVMSIGTDVDDASTDKFNILSTMTFRNSYGLKFTNADVSKKILLEPAGDYLYVKLGNNGSSGFNVVGLKKDGTYDNFASINNYSADFAKPVNVTNTVTCRGLQCTGTKNRIVNTKDFGWRALNAYETAECYFGDLMFLKTNEYGLCIIPFDEKFKQTVNTKKPYHVFVSAYYPDNEDCEIFPQVICTKREEDYFVVKSNIPNVEFSVEVKCKQIGYEDKRLEVSNISVTDDSSNVSDLNNGIIKEKNEEQVKEEQEDKEKPIEIKDEPIDEPIDEKDNEIPIEITQDEIDDIQIDDDLNI